jgi:hypothetical protein
MGLQDRDWYWKDRDRRERESTSVEDIPPVRPGARVRHATSPFGATRLPLQWRQLGLMTVVIAALIGVSFYVAHASNAARAQTAAKEHERQQGDRQKVLAEQSAEKMHQRLTAMTEQQNAEQSSAAAAKAELEALAKSRASDAARVAASWDRFYKPDPRCSASWTVECANSYIRAKRKFAEQDR